MGFQDVTPYDNHALGTISRQSSHSRLSVNPLATPNIPTIIFSSTSPRSPTTLYAPSPLSPTFSSRSQPPSTMELRSNVPTFLPPPPKHAAHATPHSLPSLIPSANPGRPCASRARGEGRNRGPPARPWCSAAAPARRKRRPHRHCATAQPPSHHHQPNLRPTRIEDRNDPNQNEQQR